MSDFARQLPVRLKAERIFYSVMAMVMVGSVFVGFAPSFFLRPIMGTPGMLPITPLVALHGAIFSAWAVLFVAQVWLVAGRRTDLHRQLGIAAFGLLPLMIVTGTLAALYGEIRDSGPPIVPPMSWLAVPLLSIPAYGGLIWVALVQRRRPQVHKRLMYMAMVVMLAAALARIPGLHGPLGIVVLPTIFVFIHVGWDYRSLRRVHPTTMWAGIVVVADKVLPFLIWKTAAWLAFAHWAVGLVA
jgi:hypothetical protein